MQQGMRQAVLLLVLVLVAACSRAPEYESVAVDESAAPLVNDEGEQEGEEPGPSPKVESYAGHRADQRYRWKRRG